MREWAHQSLRALAVSSAIAIGPTPSFAAEIVGPAIVVDGDTIRIGQERIRLLGIDAPEADQDCAAGWREGTWPCGSVARVAVIMLIGNQPVTCAWETRDQYDRALGICVTADGEQINRHMVEAGYAWAYLSDLYAPTEAEARAAERGIWTAPTETAADYRRSLREEILADQPLPPNPACVIKGNISSAGEHIYHLPGQSGYDATIIRTAQGERWFCSEADAVAAGWRARR